MLVFCPQIGSSLLILIQVLYSPLPLLSLVVVQILLFTLVLKKTVILIELTSSCEENFEDRHFDKIATLRELIFAFSRILDNYIGQKQRITPGDDRRNIKSRKLNSREN